MDIDELQRYIAQLFGNNNQQYGAPVPVPAATATPASATAPPIIVMQSPTPSTPASSPPAEDATSSMRKQFLREADEKFGSNYGQRAVASSLLDDAINSILQEQRGNASQYLERGKARGIYNDAGYNAGLATIGTADSAGRAKLRSLGDSVIDNYRTRANSVRDKAYEAIGSVTPDRGFSLDPYVSEAQEVIGRANENAAGDLRNAFGGTNLFDFSSINNRAGQAQGAVNLRDADVATALSERRRTGAMRRGLGSTGAF